MQIYLGLAMLQAWLCTSFTVHSPGVDAVSTAASRLTYRGADISSSLALEKTRHVFRGVNGLIQPIEQILTENQFNVIRLRLFVDPTAHNLYGLADTLALARRAKKHNLQIFLTIHFSHDFSDPVHHASAWQGKTFEQLLAIVYNYMVQIGNAFAPFTVVSYAIGNEITAGFMSPYADVMKNDPPAWGRFSRLLKVAINGLRHSRASGAKVMLHLDSNGNAWRVERFFKNLLFQPAFQSEQEYLHIGDFDQVGHSMYPYFHRDSTLEGQSLVQQYVHTMLNKQNVIVETSFPYRCSPTFRTQWPSQAEALMRNTKFSAEAKQVIYIDQLASLPFLSGIILFEPAWLSFRSPQTNGCEDASFFNADGGARTSIMVFHPDRRVASIET